MRAVIAAYWVLAILLVGCFNAKDPRGRLRAPRVGEPMPLGSSVVGIVHKGRTLCAHWIVADDVKYDFDVKCGSPIVVYVKTNDPQFRPPEGSVIEDTLEKVLLVKGSMLASVGGFCGVSLPSGWIARPAPGTESSDDSCRDLLSEPIVFFDTRFLG